MYRSNLAYDVLTYSDNPNLHSFCNFCSSLCVLFPLACRIFLSCWCCCEVATHSGQIKYNHYTLKKGCFYKAISIRSPQHPQFSTVRLLSQIPIPVPKMRDRRLVMTRVYMTSFEKRDFFLPPHSSLTFFSKLTLDEPDDFRLLAEEGSLHSFCGMFGLDVQSQTMSDAVTPPECCVLESLTLLM